MPRSGGGGTRRGTPGTNYGKGQSCGKPSPASFSGGKYGTRGRRRTTSVPFPRRRTSGTRSGTRPVAETPPPGGSRVSGQPDRAPGRADL